MFFINQLQASLEAIYKIKIPNLDLFTDVYAFKRNEINSYPQIQTFSMQTEIFMKDFDQSPIQASLPTLVEQFMNLKVLVNP